MKRKFNLSKFNIIFAVLGCALYLLMTVPFTPESWTELSYYKGLGGGLLACILVPLLFSWIVWFISGRKKTAANLTFPLVLVLLLSAHLFNMSGKIYSRFHPAPAENPNESGLSDTQDANLTGAQTHSLEIMQEYAHDRKKLYGNWQKAWNALQEPWVFDFASLRSGKGYDRQQKVITEYVTQSKKYKNYLLNLDHSLANKSEELGPDSEIRQESFSALENAIPLFEMHIQYGTSMLAVLSLLEDNQTKWTLYQDNFPIFNDKALAEQYEQLWTNYLTKKYAIQVIIEKTNSY